MSFEIYYVRLKYIDSIGQVVKLLILRPASIGCTFNSGHEGSRAPNVNKMGCPFYFHTSRVRLKRKYLFRSRKKEIIILHSTNAHVRCTIQQNGSQSESTIEISGIVTVFEDLNNFVDIHEWFNRSIWIDKLIIMTISYSCVAAVSITLLLLLLICYG